MMTDKKSLVSTSKFLSLILRHQPEVVGVTHSKEGWLDINELVANASE